MLNLFSHEVDTENGTIEMFKSQIYPNVEMWIANVFASVGFQVQEQGNLCITFFFHFLVLDFGKVFFSWVNSVRAFAGEGGRESETNTEKGVVNEL